LEDALQHFQGALLLISHDRALLDAVGTRTIALEDQTLHSYVGGWPEYVRVREERAELEREAKRSKPPAPVKAKPKPAPASKNNARQASRIEAAIEAAEAELARLEEELADPTSWNDPRSAKKSTARHAEAKAKVEALYAELEAVAG
jgi:ATP-binding cassette subfamily F protein 3